MTDLEILTAELDAMRLKLASRHAEVVRLETIFVATGLIGYDNDARGWRTMEAQAVEAVAALEAAIAKVERER